MVSLSPHCEYSMDFLLTDHNPLYFANDTSLFIYLPTIAIPISHDRCYCLAHYRPMPFSRCIPSRYPSIHLPSAFCSPLSPHCDNSVFSIKLTRYAEDETKLKNIKLGRTGTTFNVNRQRNAKPLVINLMQRLRKEDGTPHAGGIC